MLRQNAHCKTGIILEKWQTTGQKPCRVVASAHMWQPLALMRTGHSLRWNIGLAFIKLISVSQPVLIVKGYQITVQRNFCCFCWCFERIWKWKIHNVTLCCFQMGFFWGDIQYLKRELFLLLTAYWNTAQRADPSLAKWALQMSAFSQNPSSHLLIYIVAHSRIILITLEILYVNSSLHNSDFTLISSSKAIRHCLKIVSAALSVTMVAHLLLL